MELSAEAAACRACAALAARFVLHTHTHTVYCLIFGTGGLRDLSVVGNRLVGLIKGTQFASTTPRELITN